MTRAHRATHRDRPLDGAAAVAITAALFVIYALGACRTIYVGDSGELVTAVGILGIPHPPGYPLYVLIGWLWTHLVPFGTLAFRLSLFSSACAAAACGVLYLVSRKLQLARVPALFTAMLLAFSPSFWSQATIQRTYPLGALFLALALLSFHNWFITRVDGRLVLTLYICGLGASNNPFLAVCAVIVAVVAFPVEPQRVRRPKMLFACAGAFIAGLVPYLYLPLRSRHDPPLDWGNPESPSGLMAVVLRRDFWDRAWIESPADLPAIALDYFLGIPEEITWVGALLALVGIHHLAGSAKQNGSMDHAGTQRPLLTALLMVMATNVTLLAIHGSRSDIFIWHRYYIPSYITAALLAGAGCHALISRLPATVRLLPLIVPLVMGTAGWDEQNRSRYRIADAYSRRVLESLPPGAHLIASDDNVLFPLMYLHFVEGLRPDVNLIMQGAGGDLPPLRFDPDREALFLTHHPNWAVPGLKIVPAGMVFLVVRDETPAPGYPPVPPLLPGEDDPSVPKDFLTQNLIGQFHYMRGVALQSHDWAHANEAFDRAAESAPANDVLFYNLGLIYGHNGLHDEALDAFRRSHAINPRHLASRERPRASDRIAETESEIARLAGIVSDLAGDPRLADHPPGTPGFEANLADLLDARGETLAARGLRLRARQRGAPSF